MRKLVVACVFAMAAFAWSAAAEQLNGIITDAKCKHTDTSEKSVECAKNCIKGGQDAVLLTSDNKVYKIANPDKIMDHIGQRVAVTGDVKDDTITVDTVKARGGRKKQG